MLLQQQMADGRGGGGGGGGGTTVVMDGRAFSFSPLSRPVRTSRTVPRAFGSIVASLMASVWMRPHGGQRASC
ncbi:hypothetical protein EYF80_059506 [Liparis tanakae]|uniref:Uncharacterized protein n=1 Tax=Liparis tanakae TaxID=230148 RepID=A0A4Z2EPV4_9TELE|nr:hypothetical protein EYF80_059506 [Liparis tanakae]